MAANKFTYSDLSDGSLEKGLEELIKQLNRVDDAAEKAKESLSINKSGGGKEFEDNQKTIKSLQEIITLDKERNEILKKLNTQKQKIGKTSSEERKEEAKLKEELKRGTLAYKEQLREKREAERQAKKLTQAAEKQKQKEKDLVEAINREIKSIKDLKDQTNALVKRRDVLDQTTKSGRKEFERLTVAISNNTSKLKQFDADIQRYQRNVGNYKSALQGVTASFKSLAAGAGAGLTVLAGDLIKDGLVLLKDTATEIDNIQKGLARANEESTRFARILSAQGFELDEVLNLANKSITDFGVSSEEALSQFDSSIQRGGANAKDYISIINEYGSSFKDAGLNIEQSVAFLTQFDAAGQDIDKASDLLREFTIRFRELTPATEKALQSAGINYKELRQNVEAGNTTFSEAIQQISSAALNTKDLSKQGAILADVFGSQGEDITSLIPLFSELNTNIEDYEVTATAIEQANKRLSTAFIDLTTEGGNVNDILAGLIDFVAQVVENLDPFVDFGKELLSIFVELGDSLNELSKALGISSNSTETLSTAIEFLAFTTELALTPLILLIKAITGIIDFSVKFRNAIVDAATKLGIFDEKIAKLIKTGEFWGAVFGKVGEIIERVRDRVIEFIASTGDLGTEIKKLIEGGDFERFLIEIGDLIISVTGKLGFLGKAIQKILLNSKLFSDLLGENAKNAKAFTDQNERLGNGILKLINSSKLLNSINKALADSYDVQTKSIDKNTKTKLNNDKANKKLAESTMQLSSALAEFFEQNAGLDLQLRANNDTFKNSIQLNENLDAKYKTLISDVADLRTAVTPPKKEKTFFESIFGDSEENQFAKQQVENAVNQAIELYQEQAQARVDLVNQEIQLSQTKIEQLNSELENEISLLEQGKANNVTAIQEEIAAEEAKNEELKKQREAALKEKQRADRLSRASDIITQISSITTAIAKLFAAEANKGIIGVGIAAAAAGLLLSLFSSFKGRANNAANTQGFKDGVIDLQGEGTTTSDSIPAMLSKGESVMTAKETAKSKSILTGIRNGFITDDNLEFDNSNKNEINVNVSNEETNFILRQIRDKNNTKKSDNVKFN